ASYAEWIEALSLNDKLSASGTFAITATAGSSGAFFGWFKANEEDAGRQNSLGFRFAGEGSGARITFQLVTATNQACGTKITPWIVDKTKPKGEGRKFRPTSIKNDGTRYTWKMDYDPEASGGDGQMRFSIRSNAEKHEEFEGKTFEVNLPKGYKSHGTTFDRFGVANSLKPGNPMTIHFDDLEYVGKATDFSRDPAWIGVGNDATYDRLDEGGAHNFGFIAATNLSGGASAGEMGGMIWRSGAYGYYADRVGPLSMENRLEASGKIVLNVGSPDSGMNLGWFNSAEKELAPTQAGQFVGVRIGGPTRVGHYFVPAYATAQTKPPKPTGTREHPASVSVEKSVGPVLVPQKVFDWRIVYDPAGAGGKGTIEATLGEESVALTLKPGDKAKGASLDRFGLFTTHRGGSYVRIYFDDVKYTAASE
ncbi:MAG: hypothetical protein QOF78_294, partial [Phycisphaerales bacterium]|nr:hypothetical protein [Phycisphaerales bacterium]